MYQGISAHLRCRSQQNPCLLGSGEPKYVVGSQCAGPQCRYRVLVIVFWVRRRSEMQDEVEVPLNVNVLGNIPALQLTVGIIGEMGDIVV